MSESAGAAIQPPEAPIPPKFADAYAELQAIAERLKPNATKVPDVDEIEPLVARAQTLASHCEERIAAVKRMLDQQNKGVGAGQVCSAPRNADLMR